MIKKKCFVTAVIILFLILSSTPAISSFFYSGKDLMVLLREDEKATKGDATADILKAHEYGAYILGVYEATTSKYKVPQGTTRGQVIQIVSQYLKKNPDALSKPAAQLIQEALKQAFPLKKYKK